MNNSIVNLPFVVSSQRGIGNRFYPPCLTGSYDQACADGKENAKHYINHAQITSECSPILGRVVAGLLDIEPINDSLTDEQKSKLGHAIGFFTEIERVLCESMSDQKMRAL